MNLYIEAGHNRNDSGAVNTRLNLNERDLCIELRNLITAELNRRRFRNNGHQIIHDNDTETLQQTINRFRTTIKPEDWLISIHFNAATPQATGTEVIVQDNATNGERLFAASLSHVIALELDIRNRGVKPEAQTARKRLAILNLNCNSVLLEICFISNDLEIQNYLKNKNKVVTAICNEIFALFK